MGGYVWASAKAGEACRLQGARPQPIAGSARGVARNLRVPLSQALAAILLLLSVPASAQNWSSEIQSSAEDAYAAADSWVSDASGQPRAIDEYFYVSDSSDSFTNLNFDVGNQSVGVSNLVMSDFYHHGRSVTLGRPDENLGLTAFALQSVPTAGFDALAYTADDKNRIQGLSFNARPVRSLSENVSVTGTFYRGETRGANSGNGMIGDDSEGSGGSLAIDMHWLDQRLRLRGEIAASRFDFSDTGGETAENDLAYDFQGSYALIPGENLYGEHVSWHFGIERKRVGRQYASIANPYIAADRETTSAFTNVTWGRVSAYAQFGYETNNVEERDDLATDRRLFATFNTTYTPHVAPDRDGGYGWLGRPTFGLQTNLSDGKQIDVPAAIQTESGNYQARSMTLSAATSYQRWGLDLSQTVSSREDRTETADSMVEHQTNLGLRFATAPGLTISPYARSSLQRDNGSGQNLNRFDLGIDLTADLIPEEVNGSLNLSVNPRNDFADTPDGYFAGGEVSWNAIPAAINRSGLALALAGSFRHVEETNSTIADDAAQVFARVKLFLPLDY